MRMRWAVRPSRRSRRRTHSSVTGGRSRRRRQYAASFGTDQVAKGKPRSPGFDRATSTSSRSWLALRIGGRPRGLDTCSKVVNPEALKRCTQSYAAVKWQPTRSAASTIDRPWRTSSITRYRWWTRADNDKSLSLLWRRRCSARVTARSRSGVAMRPPWLGTSIASISPIKLDRH